MKGLVSVNFFKRPINVESHIYKVVTNQDGTYFRPQEFQVITIYIYGPNSSEN